MAYIEIKHITKRFPGVIALSDVSMSVEKGTVHALVGENGAGKSTMMKILGGLYSADSGDIYISDAKQNITSAADAIKVGISVVYQELNLMPELTVAENIYLGNLPRKGLSVDKEKINGEAQKLLDDMELNIKATDFIHSLSVSQQQMIEIAKALSNDSEIIIMDEPTASLNNREVDTLYRLIERLKSQGKTILYISHRLKEIFDLSDRITILRDGVLVETVDTEKINNEELVKLMVGREISKFYTTSDHKPGNVVLEVKNLTKEGLYKDVCFSLREGELLGMAGLMGCNREEIVQTIYGLIQADSGQILLDGNEISPKAPIDAIKCGIGYVTEDRKKSGIFQHMTVRENITMNILKSISKLGLIEANIEKNLLDKYTQSMNMKYSNYKQRIVNLSGGNQQKFLLARALASDCKVLIMLEPTRGIDVGAKAEIYALLEDLAAQGLAILIISSELPEIISVCHRTLTVFQGEITGDILQCDMDEELILQCATGNQVYKGAEN